MAKLSKVHYGRYERGTSQPTAEALSRLASALEVSVDFLLHGTKDEEPADLVIRDRGLLEKFRELEQLPDHDRRIVEELIEAFNIRYKKKAMASK